MSAPVEIFQGLAVVPGVPGTLGAFLYSLSQTIKATQNYEEEIIKDVHGYDTAWGARNEHATGDWMLKLVRSRYRRSRRRASASYFLHSRFFRRISFRATIPDSAFQLLPFPALP